MKKLMLILLSLILAGSFSIAYAGDEGGINPNFFLPDHGVKQDLGPEYRSAEDRMSVEAGVDSGNLVCEKDDTTDANWYLTDIETNEELEYDNDAELIAELEKRTANC